MQLTAQSTETFVRRFAAAPLPELEACAKELKCIYADIDQAEPVRSVARGIARMVRKQIREF